MLTTILLVIQFIFTIVMGLYFYSMLRDKNRTKETVKLQSDREMRKLSDLRQIQLSKPLAEKTRPKSFSEIVGQKKRTSCFAGSTMRSKSPTRNHIRPSGGGENGSCPTCIRRSKKERHVSLRSPCKICGNRCHGHAL